MVSKNQIVQPLLHNVGIDLRCCDIAMAEQGLDSAQIGTVLEQMAGEGMPQYMRRYVFGIAASPCCEIFQGPGKVLSAPMFGTAR